MTTPPASPSDLSPNAVHRQKGPSVLDTTDPRNSDVFKKLRRKIALMSPEPELIGALLANPSLAPHPALVPCIEWTGGLSRGLPTAYAFGKSAHPVRLYYGLPDRISRCCQTKLCVNPFHFVTLPRTSAGLTHPLVYEAEEYLDLHRITKLPEAIRRTPIPAQYVIQAFKHNRQLGLRNR